jgi:hypothetical protein
MLAPDQESAIMRLLLWIAVIFLEPISKLLEQDA